MVAVVQLPAALGLKRIDGIELEHSNTCVLETLEELARRRERANPVVDQVHLDALPLLFEQHVGEASADLIIFQDEGLQIDVVAGARDGREHGRISRRSVLEQHGGVACRQRTAGDLQLQRQVPFEMACLGTREPPLVEQRLALARRQHAAVCGLDLYRCTHVAWFGTMTGSELQAASCSTVSRTTHRVRKPSKVPVIGMSLRPQALVHAGMARKHREPRVHGWLSA